MSDNNGMRNPWDFGGPDGSWNPSGAPAAGTAGPDNNPSAEQAQPTGTESPTSVPSGSQPPAEQPAQPAASRTAWDIPALGEVPSAQPAQPASAPSAPSPSVPSQAAPSVPEYGATTANPTQPLPASAYPFGAPDAPETAQQPQPAAGNNPFNPFGFGQSNQTQPNQSGQSPAQPQAGQPGSGNQGQQPTEQYPGFFGGPVQNGPQAGGGFGQPDGGNGPGGQNGNGLANPAASNHAGHTWLAAVIAAVLTALLVLGLGYAAIANGLVSLPQTSSTSFNSASSGSNGTAKIEGTGAPDWQAVNKKVAASVVSIATLVPGGSGQGSGAIISSNGDIITNNHVIEKATQIQVTLSNGNLYTAKLVGTDPTTDIAVIKLDNPPSGLQPVTFADSSEVVVGEPVMAIGNPLGYEATATTGVVSALSRPVAPNDETNPNNQIVTNAIQIDASINPGNSGGPTFNAAGKVIGINSSIATASTQSTGEAVGGSIGLGFAIPSNLAQRIANQLIKDGKVQHVLLGVSITTATATADGATRAGAKVSSVVSGGSAAKAGIKDGDVIVGFNGSPVSNTYSLLGYVRATALGETVKLTVVRGGHLVDLNATLDQVEPAQTAQNNNDNNNNGGGSGNDGGSGGGSGNGGGSGGGGLWDPFEDLFGFGGSGSGQ